MSAQLCHGVALGNKPHFTLCVLNMGYIRVTNCPLTPGHVHFSRSIQASGGTDKNVWAFLYSDRGPMCETSSPNCCFVSACSALTNGTDSAQQRAQSCLKDPNGQVHLFRRTAKKNFLRKDRVMVIFLMQMKHYFIYSQP